MKRLLVTSILLAGFVELVAGQEPRVEKTRPEAPAGFRWQELEDIPGSFVLLPAGWHYWKAASKDSVAHRVTKEDPQDGPFLTGLTINVVRDVKKKTDLDPSLYAVHYVSEYMKGNKVLIKPDKILAVGPFQRISCQVEKPFAVRGKERLCHVRVVTYANDKTGTLYVVIFGAPVEEWDEAWKIGKQLFNPILLSDKI